MAKKILCSVISFILCAVLAFVSCYFAIPDFNAWVKNKIAGIGFGGNSDDKQPDIDGDKTAGAGGALISGINSNGVQLLSAEIPVSAYSANGISPQAETAYMLTATTIPETATNFLVDWSIAWVNGESEWASGKTVTDYVELAGNEVGTATVSVLQPFGEQVKITVVSRDNSDATANCVCDYVKRLSFDYAENDMSTFTVYKDTATASDPFSVYVYTDYGVGTVSGVLDLSWVRVDLSQSTFTSLNDIYQGSCFDYSCGTTDYSIITKINENCFDIIFGGCNDIDTLFGLYDENGVFADGKPTNGVMLAYLKLHTADIKVCLGFNYTYKIADKVFHSEIINTSFSDRLTLSNCVGYKIPVSGLNVSDTNIAF